LALILVLGGDVSALLVIASWKSSKWKKFPQPSQLSRVPTVLASAYYLMVLGTGRLCECNWAERWAG